MGANTVKDFEMDLAARFGERMKGSDDFCKQVWSSLANIIWRHEDQGLECGATFRSAGRLIAEIIGTGDYMDWYCCGPYETVSDEIKKGMAKDGWKPYHY